VKTALNVALDENIKMVSESIAQVKAQGRDPLFDAEHFFDGYKANPDYALEVIQAANDAGARWVVLCDTNGGSLPYEVGKIVSEVVNTVPGEHLGIHCHNDTESAVANSIAAVQAGVRQIQGTINGIGERCGNANLISIIPNLIMKLGYETGVQPEKLKELTSVSRLVDDRLNRQSNPHLPYVGEAAFAHKGGLHVSAMAKDTSSYEHVDPASVGNSRIILVSDKAGRSNILDRLQSLNIEVPSDDERVNELVKEVKEREKLGYAYDDADASFELLARRMFGSVPEYFTVKGFRAINERRYNAKGKLVNESETSVKVQINGDDEVMTVAEGMGPVHALDKALRKALIIHYPQVKNINLTDYKVRILNPDAATEALTRVMIESADNSGKRWNTIGVSSNIIDASFQALYDGITYQLFHEGVKA
jgi:2-isopropylmalate synthase